MGIKNLNKFLRGECPDVFEPVHLSEYAFKKMAIDTSLYLCNYKACYGEKGWLPAFIRLVACLRKNEIHCVFIYDSGAPADKDAERKERSDSRDRLRDRLQKIKDAVETYTMTGEIDPELIEFQKSRKITSESLLRNRTNINIPAIEKCIEKMERQLFSISSRDFELTRELFDILDVPYFFAPLEAETMCADLCRLGQVDAVLSEDTDVLAYGAPVFLTKINTSDETCFRLQHETVLQALELTESSFLDFCIMCGTDYNKNIYKVGPIKSYKLIREYGSLENIRDNSKIDTSILKFERVRELFTQYEKTTINVPYCGRPNFPSLEEFLFRNNLKMDISGLKKHFTEQDIIILEEGDPEPEDEKEDEKESV